jgi:hypothetical protein
MPGISAQTLNTHVSFLFDLNHIKRESIKITSASDAIIYPLIYPNSLLRIHKFRKVLMETGFE